MGYHAIERAHQKPFVSLESTPPVAEGAFLIWRGHTRSDKQENFSSDRKRSDRNQIPPESSFPHSMPGRRCIPIHTGPSTISPSCFLPDILVYITKYHVQGVRSSGVFAKQFHHAADLLRPVFPATGQRVFTSERGKALYKRRKETIERRRADAKKLHGLRYARVRGLAKGREQCLLIAVAQHIKKMALLLPKRGTGYVIRLIYQI